MVPEGQGWSQGHREVPPGAQGGGPAPVQPRAVPRFGPYYAEPVIAGLEPGSLRPFLCSLDLIGCPMVTEDFVLSGTCSEQMYGMCESLWEPDMVSAPGGTWGHLGTCGDM
ncbi:hypothetical protein DV515_00019890 [Chloebia gouldiae]|uniref:Uncharacterized protein n=1 Tax=Chloebia gouldiae TaxID=44316 RepID=A0A3L8Q3E4_CHLGU|nr:hypothetical protein DV515_00019890 [Chloebia gouldiae]